jgi:hypothetical protein
VEENSMRDSQIFAARAEAAHAEAQGASLDNVRDRALRSEKAWAEMADRSRKMESSRDARAQVVSDTSD